MQDSHRALAITLCTLFTAAQVVILFVFGYTPYPDSMGYERLAADSLLFGEPYPVAEKIQELAFIWNVGAINAVALSLWLWHSITPLLIAYSVMKGLTAWLLYRVSSRLFSPSVAIAALLLYVLYPANYGEGTSAHSELPFIFLLMTSLWLGLCHRRWLLAGMALMLAHWFRPMTATVLLTLILFLGWKQRKNALKLIGGYALVALLIGGLCQLRTGKFIFQAQTGWMALLQYSVDNTPEEEDDRLTVVNGRDACHRNDLWRARWMEWVSTHKTDYLRQMPKKLARTYVSDNINFCAFLPDKAHRTYLYEELSMPVLLSKFPYLNAIQWLTVVNLLYYYLLLMAAGAAVIILWRLKAFHTLLIPMGIIGLGTLLLLFFGHGESRFHIPFMPFFIMLAGVTVTAFRNKGALLATDNALSGGS